MKILERSLTGCPNTVLILLYIPTAARATETVTTTTTTTASIISMFNSEVRMYDDVRIASENPHLLKWKSFMTSTLAGSMLPVGRGSHSPWVCSHQHETLNLAKFPGSKPLDLPKKLAFKHGLGLRVQGGGAASPSRSGSGSSPVAKVVSIAEQLQTVFDKRESFTDGC